MCLVNGESTRHQGRPRSEVISPTRKRLQVSRTKVKSDTGTSRSSAQPQRQRARQQTAHTRKGKVGQVSFSTHHKVVACGVRGLGGGRPSHLHTRTRVGAPRPFKVQASTAPRCTWVSSLPLPPTNQLPHTHNRTWVPEAGRTAPAMQSDSLCVLRQGSPRQPNGAVPRCWCLLKH